MKKLFFALMLGLAVAASCTPEYDDTAINDRMDKIEQEAENLDAALNALMERIAAAEKAIDAINKAAADEDYVVSVVASEDGKGVLVSFRNAEAVFIPLDLDASMVDGVVISDVKVSEETATFTYTDGTEVVLPLYKEKAFALVLETAEFTVNAGETVKVAYTVEGATENTVVDVLATSAGYVAKVTETHVEITVPSPFVDGDVLVWADNGAGKTSIKKVSFEENAISVEAVAEVAAEGGEVVIKGVSNVEVTAEVVEGADWLTAVPATKAEFAFKFNAAANEGEARTAKVAIKTAAGVLLQEVTVAQAAGILPFATLVWDATVPFGGGQDRNMTMDSEYVYVAQAAGGNGAIKAISIADPTQVKDVKVTTYTPAGLDNGTHAISCVRMLPNTDASVNGGKPVLVASNLTTGDGTEKLIVYVWSNGIDADPDYFVIDSGARRLGDKFTVKGTYQAGELHFFDFNDGNTVIRVNMKDGVAGLWGTPELAYATGRFAIPVAGVSNIGECTIHPDATFDGDGNPSAALLTTNAVNGFFTQEAGNAYAASAWGTDPKLTQTYGYNFFEHNGKDYIAYVKVAGDRASAALNVIEDVNGAADFKGTLEAQTGLFTAPVNGTGNAGHGLGDCATAVVDGVRYIAVMGQNIGISLYKLN
ncbi:MAG: BACON domain-containing protein [Bacteroidales bacterium]|nr:BACON domain-containing protein [Bacteroidales bacterium]